MKAIIIRYIKVAGLPLLLAGIFVVQNYAFNRWLNIVPELYLVRRTAVTLALGILIYGPAVLFKKHGRFIYLSITSLVISILFLVQFMYFRFSGGVLQASSLKYAEQAAALGGTINTLIEPKLLIFIANLIVLAGAFAAWKTKFFNETLSRLEKIIALLLILLTIMSGYGLLIAFERHDWGDASRLYKRLYDLDTLVAKVGIVNFSLEDVAKLALRSNNVTEDDKKFLADWSSNRAQPPALEKDFGLAKGRNLIIIQVESLETSAINYKPGGQEVTPTLNALTKDALYFPNYYSQFGPGNTADAEFTTMTSLYPLSDSVVFIDYASHQYEGLPQLLRNNGYHAFALHGDIQTFWNRVNIYPNLGYEKWFMRPDYTIPRSVGFGELGDADFFPQTISKIKTLPQPFLATVITMTSHTPYIIPDDLKALDFPDDTGLNENQKNYLQSVRYTDQAIGNFIDQLKQNGLYDNSVIVIYGDHGGFSNIESVIGPDKNALSGLANAHIPLFILAPGTNLHGTMETPGSHLDLFPTLTNLLGLTPPRSVLGQDLINTKTPVVTRRVIGSPEINTIITDKLSYESARDGVYDHGACMSWPNREPLPVDNCRQLYDEQTTTMRASDIAVRGDLVRVLLDSVLR